MLYRVIRLEKNSGFILITVLLFLQMLVLLSLFAFQASWLEYKANQEQLEKYYIENNRDQLIQEIEQAIQEQKPTCFVDLMPISEILAQPFSWWQRQSCTGNFQSIQYYYVFESLGQDPCAHIMGIRDRIASYYRLTLALFKGVEPISFVQSTIVVPDQSLTSCESVLHAVTLGRQSWWEF